MTSPPPKGWLSGWNMRRPTSLQLRWSLLGAFLVVSLAGILWPRLPYKVESTQMCAVTGALRREILWFGIRRRVEVESTALAGWIQTREPDFEFRFVPRCRFESLLFMVRRTCLAAPPVTPLRRIDSETLARVPEARVRELLDLLTTSDSGGHRDSVIAFLAELDRLQNQGTPPESWPR